MTMSTMKQDTSQKRRVFAIFMPQIGISSIEKKSRAELRETVVFYCHGSACGDSPQRTILTSQRIDEVTSDLYQYGIYPSMRLQDAQQRVPLVQLETLQSDIVDSVMQQIRTDCFSITPAVSLSDRVVFLDVTARVEPLDKLAAEICLALKKYEQQFILTVSHTQRISAAWGRELFFRKMRQHGLQEGWRGEIALAQPTPAELQEMSLLSLSIPPEQRDELYALGIHTVNDLSRLDVTEMSCILREHSPEVLRFLQRGGDIPVQIYQQTAPIQESADFDFGVHSLEPLQFALKPLCRRILKRLHREEKTLLRLSVSLEIEPEDFCHDSLDMLEKKKRHVQFELDFPMALSEEVELNRAVVSRLEQIHIQGRVMEITLLVTDAGLREKVQAAFPWADHQQEKARIVQMLSAFLAEVRGDPKNEAGCLSVKNDRLPERMSHLASFRPSFQKDRRSVEMNEQVGLFMQKWPWPTHFLPKPLLDERAKIRERHLFCVLEGMTADYQPYLRRYEYVTMEDGRCALGYSDPETDEFWIQAWFN